MRFLFIAKFPPIQGGVSSQVFNTVKSLAQKGHSVIIVTNANEVEPGYKAFNEDKVVDAISTIPNVIIYNTSIIKRQSYIPWTNPYATKLFGLANEACANQSIDCIIGYYFEPYAFVAALTSRVNNIPLILVHAGSDLSKLSKHSDLSLSYSWMMQQCNAMITSMSEKVRISLQELSLSDKKMIFLKKSALPEYFRNIKLNKSLSDCKNEFATINFEEYFSVSKDYFKKIEDLNKKSVNSSCLKIGFYGKVGPFKGLYELVAALSRLVNHNFQLFIILSGDKKEQEKLLDIIYSHRLQERTFIFPPLVPWEIPSVISNWDIIASLENNFPVNIHTPLLSREILAVGSCLLISKEIYEKQSFSENLIDQRNCIIIDSPLDIDELTNKVAFLLENPDIVKYVATNGLLLSKTIEEFYNETDALSDAIEDISSEIVSLKNVDDCRQGLTAANIGIAASGAGH